MEKILTSTALWQDFDPTAEPLDTNVLKTEEKDGCTVKTVYFTGRTVADGKSRILAKVCYKGAKPPKAAVLLIENYKKPINEQELLYWANNGFTAAAIDFAGRRTKGICTLYPVSLDYCNSDVAKSYFYIGNDAHQSKIYEYALNCMRAVTYLIQEEKVKTISAVTVKKGATVGLIVMGTDTRLQNGTVVFGSLYRQYPTESYNGTMELDSEELAERLDLEEKSQIWTAALAPQSYTIRTKIPLYVIVSADSPYVSIVDVNKMFGRLPGGSKILFLPITMDYLPDDHVQSIVKWCKGGSVEESITLQQETVDGADNFVKVTTKLPMSKLTLWYTRTADSLARNWVKAPLKKAQDGYIAELDVYEQTSNILAFVSARGTINFCGTLCEMKVFAPQKVKTPTRNIYSGNNDDNLVPIVRSTDWHGEQSQVEYCKGYLDIYGAKGKCLATFAVNDSCVRRREIFTISFDICCDVVQPLRVYTMVDFGVENTLYQHTVQLSGDGKWQRITLEGGNFHSVDGRQMREDSWVQMLCFEADQQFIINNIFLV